MYCIHHASNSKDFNASKIRDGDGSGNHTDAQTSAHTFVHYVYADIEDASTFYERVLSRPIREQCP